MHRLPPVKVAVRMLTVNSPRILWNILSHFLTTKSTVTLVQWSTFFASTSLVSVPKTTIKSDTKFEPERKQSPCFATFILLAYLILKT